jgi:hypothetical protein
VSRAATRASSIDWALSKRILIFWVGLFLLAIAIDRNRWVLTWPGFIESWSWLVLLTLFAWSPPVRSFLRALPRAHSIFVAAVVGALLFGQFMGAEPERSYPIVMWRMFSGDVRRLQPFTYLNYVGESSVDGKPHELDPVRLFPPLTNERLTIAIGFLTRDALAEPPDARGGHDSPTKRQQLDLALAAIGRAYNREHPEQPIARIGLDRCQFSPEKRAVVARERVRTVEVGPDVSDGGSP